MGGGLIASECYERADAISCGSLGSAFPHGFAFDFEQELRPGEALHFQIRGGWGVVAQYPVANSPMEHDGAVHRRECRDLDQVLRLHPSIGNDGEQVLPSLLHLGFQPLSKAAVGLDPDLARNDQTPPREAMDHTVAVAALRASDARWQDNGRP
jgi:hypothetical protein